MTFTRRTLLSIPLIGPLGATAQTSTGPASVSAAEKEGGILIYSVSSADQWKPLLQAFAARYPRIPVQTLDLPTGPECFERYLAETATNARTADMIVVQARDLWLDFHRRGEVLAYESPEAPHWPAWSKPLPGLYTPWLVPVALVWNNLLVPPAQRPRTMEEFVATVNANGAAWRNKIATYPPSVYSNSLNYVFLRKHGEKGWNWLQTLAKSQPRFERSAGTMVEKVALGEYAACWFVGSSLLGKRTADAARTKLIGWSLIGDGTPIALCGAGIPKRARNVNSAKLFLDFMLSEEGQYAIGRGGTTPSRPDIEPENENTHTYKSIAKAVGGQQNMVLVDWAPNEKWDMDGMMARYRTTFGIK